MLSPEELKKRKDILGRVDWEMTPQEAFEAYQVASINSWKHRDLQDAYYFEIYVHKDKPKVLLIKRTLKDSEELAELPAPLDLMKASLPVKSGGGIPQGHYPLDRDLKDWIEKELEE